MKNISIDSDVFIASEISTEPNHKKSKEFMEYILSNKLKDMFFFTSIFTFLELASAMIRRTNDKDKPYSLLYRITNSWKKTINPLPLTSSKKQVSANTFSKEVVDNLIETAIKFNTKSGDTIQSQAILENQIDCFITWNKKDFLRLQKKIKDFKVLNPSEFLDKIQNNKDGTSNYIKIKKRMTRRKINALLRQTHENQIQTN